MNASASEREAVGSVLEREGKEREEINQPCQVRLSVKLGWLYNHIVSSVILALLLPVFRPKVTAAESFPCSRKSPCGQTCDHQL